MASEDTDKIAVLQGTLDLIVLRTLQTMGRQHAYAIANRLQQVSGDQLLPQSGHFVSGARAAGTTGEDPGAWGKTENNREAKFYSITKAGEKRWLRKRCAGGECRGWWKSCFPKGREACADSSPDSAIYFRRRRADRELAREIECHLALLQEDFEQRGLPREQAKQAARRAYGGVEQAKELHREARSFLWIEHVIMDLRYGGRNLLRDTRIHGRRSDHAGLGYRSKYSDLQPGECGLVAPAGIQGCGPPGYGSAQRRRPSGDGQLY